MNIFVYKDLTFSLNLLLIKYVEDDQVDPLFFFMAYEGRHPLIGLTAWILHLKIQIDFWVLPRNHAKPEPLKIWCHVYQRRFDCLSWNSVSDNSFKVNVSALELDTGNKTNRQSLESNQK